MKTIPKPKGETQQKKHRAGIFFGKQTLDKLLRHKHSDAMIALYVFLNYTALWQGTNQPRATVPFIARGLRWGVNKVRRIKSLLAQIGLVEDLCSVDPDSKQITGHYVRVSYFHPHCFREDGKATLTVLPRVAKWEANALRANNGNALRVGKLSLSRERTRFFSKSMPPPFLEGLTAVQQGMARDYNQTFVPLDWMPAKKPTDKLREILEIHDHDPEGWRELIADVAAHPETWPKRRRSRTIFRIGWDNI